MASSEVERLIGEVEALTGADPHLARLWVRHAWRDTMRVRDWSFLHRRTHLVVKAAITSASTSATCDVVQGSDIIEFSSNIITDSVVGMQFRIGLGPIYDIIGHTADNRVRVRPFYADADATGQDFTIFNPYIELPPDCRSLVSVVNTSIPRPVKLNYQREVLDAKDPLRQRYFTGNGPTLLCPLDYSVYMNGSADQPRRVIGAGSKPIASGVYEGQDDATFTIQMTSTDLGGAATFTWCKDEDAMSTTVVSDASVGNTLSDGVSVLFDAASTYTSGTVFVILARARAQAGLPRQEVYPCPQALTVLPTLYLIHIPDITDDDFVVPAPFAQNLDVISEKALFRAASHTDTKYAQINRAERHNFEWARKIVDLERIDTELMQRKALRAITEDEVSWPADPQEFDDPSLYDAFH